MINDALLAGLICVLLGVLIAWQMKDDQFDLRYLLVDSQTNKVSLFKLGQLLALLTSTWALIYETRTGNLTEWLFLAYIATWSGANVASKIVDRKPEAK